MLITECVICMGIPFLVPEWTAIARVSTGMVLAALVLWIGYQTGQCGRQQVVGMIWQQSGEWSLKRRGESAYSPGWQLDGWSQVSPFHLSMRWTRPGQVARLIVFRAEVSALEWRQWRTRLKFSAVQTQRAPEPEL